MEATDALTWTAVADLVDLPPDRGLSRKVGDERIALFLVRGEVYAVRDQCPHQGALLSDGGAYDLDGQPVVVCPLHYWTFSLRTGVALSNEWYEAQTYPVRVEGTRVLVGLPNLQSTIDD